MTMIIGCHKIGLQSPSQVVGHFPLNFFLRAIETIMRLQHSNAGVVPFRGIMARARMHHGNSGAVPSSSIMAKAKLHLFSGHERHLRVSHLIQPVVMSSQPGIDVFQHQHDILLSRFFIVVSQTCFLLWGKKHRWWLAPPAFGCSPSVLRVRRSLFLALGAILEVHV